MDKKTTPYTPAEQERLQALLNAACEATEAFTEDELEAHAARLAAKTASDKLKLEQAREEAFADPQNQHVLSELAKR